MFRNQVWHGHKTGYDDVFIYAPVQFVVEVGDTILGFDGCLNFFAGPTDNQFSANLNFYKVHYNQHHVAGTSGSTLQDIKDIVALMNEGRLSPAVMVTHVGGLDAVVDTTLNLPKIPGGKKLVYTHIQMPMTPIASFRELGASDSRYTVLADILDDHKGLWCVEAERYLLEHFS